MLAARMQRSTARALAAVLSTRRSHNESTLPLDDPQVLYPRCSRAMLASPRKMIALAVIGAAVVLVATQFAPQPAIKSALPADSFARAIQTGNGRLLELCISERADPNGPGADGRTPLLIAVQQQDRGLIARLLELGASVDVADHTGLTPVMLAAASGQLDLLRTFLERSQQPGALDHEGRSAAHHAVLAQQPEALELALSALNEPDTTTLLASACETGNLRMIRRVLERAPAGLEWSAGTRRALSIALAERDADSLRLLLGKHAAPPTLEGGTTPLLAHAIAIEDTELFNALLAAGADPNTVVPTPTDKSFVSLVKSENLRSYLRGDDGVTVLMLAAASGQSEYVRALLDAGADRNRQTSRFKMLALYFAARTEKSNVVQMLLGRGPSPDQLRVEISLAMQKASVLKNGVPILQTSVSTGRKGFDTPAGEYVVTDKKRDHVSSIYKVPMPFFMRLNCRDFGLHAGAVPRYPASHGCIRLPADIAQKLFSEIPVGTVVTIN